MASLSERESREIEAANASGTTPVVLIHGLWLLPSSWANWTDFFQQAGYAPLAPAPPGARPGLWLLPSSWANWTDFFQQAGYAPLTPDWPDDPETVEAARANPDVLARKTLNQVADHTTEIINALDKKPAV